MTQLSWLLVSAITIAILLLYCMNANKLQGFSVSNKPMEHDWDRLNRNPYDDVDYITPVYMKFPKN